MFKMIIAVLLALWLLGLGTSFTLGGFIHILLAVAIILLVIQFIQSRRRIIRAKEDTK